MKKIEIRGSPSEIGNIYYANYKKLDKNKKYVMSIQDVCKDRSLFQNSMYWGLLQQYAEWARESTNKLHNEMLSRYGVKTNVYVLIPEESDIDNMTDIHLEKTSNAYVDKKGKMFIRCRVLKGSHSYNTSEMTRLIDGLVSEIQQCKAEIDVRGYSEGL